MSTSHTYATAGTKTISLTVTDDDGESDQTAQDVTVAQPAEVISFVGQSMSNLNATSHTVTVPITVAPGDGLLLFFSSGIARRSPNRPA